MIASACGGIGGQGDISTSDPTLASAAGRTGCPVTVPEQPGFVPPEPYPPEPFEHAVWYGSPELWTILDAGGAVWRYFLLVGLVLPEPGCWEVTAEYRGATPTSVLRVEG